MLRLGVGSGGLPCGARSVCTLPPHLACLQGFGGPCCARILTSWFATKERGTYWGMWNIAHNLGGFAAPILAGGAARSMGWKWGEHQAPHRCVWYHRQLSCGGLHLLASGCRPASLWPMLSG